MLFQHTLLKVRGKEGEERRGDVNVSVSLPGKYIELIDFS